MWEECKQTPRFVDYPSTNSSTVHFTVIKDIRVSDITQFIQRL